MDNLISHQRVNSTGRVVVSDEYNRPLTVAELMLEYPQESRGRISVISYEWEKAVSIASGQEARDRQGAHHASHETRKASLIVIGRSPTATFNGFLDNNEASLARFMGSMMYTLSVSSFLSAGNGHDIFPMTEFNHGLLWKI
ncbi:hypothetical protein LguiA_034352 [Lonicera macranthoides]